MSNISLVNSYFPMLANRLGVLSTLAFSFTTSVSSRSLISEQEHILFLRENLPVLDPEYEHFFECYREFLRVVKKEIKMNTSVLLSFQKLREAVIKLDETKRLVDNDRKLRMNEIPLFSGLRDNFGQFYQQVIMAGKCLEDFRVAIKSFYKDSSAKRRLMRSRILKIIIGLIIVILLGYFVAYLHFKRS